MKIRYKIALVVVIFLTVMLTFRPLQYFYPVTSDSMEPTYPIGDWTFTNPFEKPKIGDVVWFSCKDTTPDSVWCNRLGINGESSLYHRWVGIEKSGCYWIIGDNPQYDWSDPSLCYMPDDIEIRGVVHKLEF